MDKKYIDKNELDKACFQHDMAYGDFKDSERRTVSDKIFRDKTFNIAKTPKYDEHQRGRASIFYNFFEKKSAGSGVNTNANYEKLAEELHKSIIRKFKKGTVYSRFEDNIWGAD